MREGEGKFNPERQAEEESSMEGLLKRAGIVRELRQMLDGFPDTLSTREVDVILEDKLKGIFERFSDEAVEKARVWRELVQNRDALLEKVTHINHKREKQFEAGEISEEEFLEATPTDEEGNTLVDYHGKLNELEMDNDAHFVAQLIKGKEAFVDKYANVREYEENESLIVEHLQSRGVDLKIDDILRTVPEPFHIGVVVSDEKMKEVRGDVNGVHYSGTAISLITESIADKPEQFKKTNNHEKVHNFLDASAYHKSHNKIDFIESAAKRAKESLGYHLDFLIENAMQALRNKVQGLSSEHIIDEQHEEIIAGLERAEERGFGVSSGVNDFAAQVLGGSDEVSFSKAASVFSTAGREMFNFRDALLSLEKDIGEILQEIRRGEFDVDEDTEWVEGIQETIQTVKKDFVEMTRELDDSFTTAKYLSQEAHELVHAACVVLKPSQYEYIESMLEEKFGKDEVERVGRRAEILEKKHDFVYSTERIKAFLDEFAGVDPKDVPATVSEGVKDFFANLSEEAYVTFMENGTDDFESFDDYTEFINRLEELSGVYGGGFGEAEKHAAIGAYFSNEIDKAAVGSDYQNIPSIEEMDDAQREGLTYAFEVSLQGFLFEDIARNADIVGPINMEDLHSSKLWNFLEDLGLVDGPVGLSEVKSENHPESAEVFRDRVGDLLRREKEIQQGED
jgi:hypothetical protein